MDPRRTGDVEVAQGRVAQTVDLVEPGEHLLDHQLGLAVDVGGAEARGLLNRDRLRLTVDGGGGRKDQAPGPWARTASRSERVEAVLLRK